MRAGQVAQGPGEVEGDPVCRGKRLDLGDAGGEDARDSWVLLAVAQERAPQFALILEQLLSARSELGKPREPGHWVSFFDSLLGLIGWPAERSLTKLVNLSEFASVRVDFYLSDVSITTLAGL